MNEDRPEKTRIHLSRSASISLIGMFFIAIIHTLFWASSFFIPVCAAILMYFIVNRPRRWLERRHVSSFVTAAVACLAIGALVFAAMYRLSGPVMSLLGELPQMLQEIDRLLSTGGGPLESIDQATAAAEEMMDDPENDRVEVEVVTDGGLFQRLISVAPSLLGQVVFSLVLLFFLISSGDQFILRLVQSHRRFSDKRRAVEAFHAIESQLGLYLGGITAINFGLGVAVAAAMTIWGMETPIVLGTMAFLLNFVPFLGAIAGVFVAFGLAFVEMRDIWPALGVAATYLAITSVEGQLVTPYLISQRLRLNTTVVFLAVAFFAWIWSVMGMVVALPVLIVVKIASDHIEGLQTFGQFLGEYTRPDRNGHGKEEVL